MATVEEIREKLHKGVVVFTFLKSDGSIRVAKGTLQKKVLDEKMGRNWVPSRLSSPKVQVFYDLEKDAFRSFTIGTEREIMSFEAGM